VQSGTAPAKLFAIAEGVEPVSVFAQENPNCTKAVELLTAGNITALASVQPAIYGDLPQKDLYKVTYSTERSGYMLIIDAEEGKVLKYFKTAPVVLG
jgi:hypothetical protein